MEPQANQPGISEETKFQFRMHTVIGQSASGTFLKKSLRFHYWNSSNNLSDSPTKTFWEIKTNVRKTNFIEYLKMKHLVQGLSDLELQCLVDAPGVLSDDLYLDALRAWRTEVPKKILWQRLGWLQELIDLNPWSLNLYYTYNGNIVYQISELRSSIRKVEKYSGYVRNSSAVGSKRQSKNSIPEPERFDWNIAVKFDFYLFLTVGEFDSGIPGSSITLMMDKRKVRNGSLL